jgi:hypothetical protein
MKEETVTSIQNLPDRKRVEAITITRQTRSRTPPTGLGAQRGAGHNKTAPQPPADDAPPVQLHAPPLHAPSADASGRATRLVRAPHRTDGDQDGQIFWTGRASPPPNRDAQGVTAMHKAFIAALKQVKMGKFDADGDEL